ncbi:uncharacterized protein [Temnothorax longispinosus]|uniref:uncharacterized protein n=1 Tax=Temnothorax longispinosus TaxID=300112 RepID=UPI003A9A6328
MTKSCAVPMCKSRNYSAKKCSLFKVPSNIEQCKKWIAAIPGIVDLKPSQFVCEKHFEEHHILKKWVKYDNDRIIAEAPYMRTRLHPLAVPSKFDCQRKVENIATARDCSSGQRISAEHNYFSLDEPSMNTTVDESCNEKEPSFVQDVKTNGSSVMDGVDIKTTNIILHEDLSPRDVATIESIQEQQIQDVTTVESIQEQQIQDVATVEPIQEQQIQDVATVEPIQEQQIQDVATIEPIQEQQIQDVATVEPIQEQQIQDVATVEPIQEQQIQDVATVEPIQEQQIQDVVHCRTNSGATNSGCSHCRTNSGATNSGCSHCRTNSGATNSGCSHVEPIQEQQIQDVATVEPIQEQQIQDVATVESLHEQQIQDHPVAHCAPDVCERRFHFSQVTFNYGTPGKITDSTSIPWPWTVGELSTDIGSFLFTYAITKMENDDKFPVIEKSIQLCANKELRYFVYGSVVKVHGCKLPQILEDIASLPQALKKFQNINVCNGLGTNNVHHLSADSAFKDYVDRWRSKNCTLISKRKRCDHCMNVRNVVHMKEARSKTKVSLKRVNRVSNPIDQRKLIALRKKCFRERRQKKTAQKRIQLLQESLQNKQPKLLRFVAKRWSTNARN